jgi:hypothetical protein
VIAPVGWSWPKWRSRWCCWPAPACLFRSLQHALCRRGRVR